MAVNTKIFTLDLLMETSRLTNVIRPYKLNESGLVLLEFDIYQINIPTNICVA